jgi:hypothetical protein
VTGEEMVGNDPCVIVEGSTPYGHYRLWLDQRNGLRCAKALAALGPGDIYDLRTRRLPDESSITRVETMIENIAYSNVGKYVLASSGEITKTTHFADGRADVERMIQKRGDVQIDPDFAKAKAFIMDGIPDGTPVEIHYDGARPADTRHYVWRGGRITADDDKATTWPAKGNAQDESH